MRRPHVVPLLTLLTLVTVAGASAQAQQPAFIGMGDSLGEGVQSADSNILTQPNSYLNRIAIQMGVSFPLPVIIGNPLAFIESVAGRSRLFPNFPASDLAVSGATVDSMLNQVAKVPITTEADLVLEPRTGTQMQIAQSLEAPFVACWVGNTDALSAVLAWQQLDASQLTSVAQFTADYATIANDLAAMHSKVVVATIPYVTQVAFLFSREDLIKFLGQDFGLPEGSYTSLPMMLLLKLGLANAATLQNPNYVLDPTEIKTIQQRVDTFNQIIRQHAQAAGFAVADINTLFEQVQQTPPVFDNVAITRRFNGGIFSLDGVHPSNIGHAIVANAFIAAANAQFGMHTPPIGQDQLNQIAATDPFIDWNGNLIVPGRPFTGLLETVGPFLGISGDVNDKPQAHSREVTSGVNPVAGREFLRRYRALKGLPPKEEWGLEEAMSAIGDVFKFWAQ